MIGAEADSAFCKMGNGAVSVRVGGAGVGADHSPTFSAGSENVCSSTSTPPLVFLKHFQSFFLITTNKMQLFFVVYF